MWRPEGVPNSNVFPNLLDSFMIHELIRNTKHENKDSSSLVQRDLKKKLLLTRRNYDNLPAAKMI